MKRQLLENIFLQKVGGTFRRTSVQLNQLLESDAELLRLPDGSILAATTDAIAEEIATGLYTDPAHIGWMTVVVNLSDLAAVGARPLGLLLSENFPPDFSEKTLESVQKGIESACTATGVCVLGGDTNTAPAWVMGGTALGLIPAGERFITRKGAHEGDLLYSSGPMGLGSAYAFSVLFGKNAHQVPYQPLPRLKEGELVRKWGSCCIDTSDGFFHALSNLQEINSLRFQIESDLSAFLHPAAHAVSQQAQLPGWVLLAGPHGEFELLFTIPPEQEKDFLTETKSIGWQPVRLGSCIAGNATTLRTREGNNLPVDIEKIADAFEEADGNPQVFLEKLLKLELIWDIQKNVR